MESFHRFDKKITILKKVFGNGNFKKEKHKIGHIIEILRENFRFFINFSRIFHYFSVFEEYQEERTLWYLKASGSIVAV